MRLTAYPRAVLDDLIQKAYLSAIDVHRWSEFLQVACNALDGQNATLVLVDRENGGVALSAAHGLDPDAMRLYSEKYAAIDPLANGAAALGPLHPGFIGLCQQLISDEQLVQTDYYKLFGQPYGCLGGIICCVYANGPLTAAVGVNRKPGHLFGDPEVELFRDLFPHLRTAMQMHRELQRDVQVGRAALSTLDKVTSVAFICDDTGKIVYRNRAAEKVNPRLAPGSLLALPSPSDTTALRRAIAARPTLNAASEDATVALAKAFDGPTLASVSALQQRDW